MATADGGVIGELGATFDSAGRANGRANQGTASLYSWTWNAYGAATSGIVARISIPALFLAQSWWPFGGGNASKNQTAVQQPWFKELETCPGAATPCPQEALVSALKSLKAIFDAPSCPACDTYLYAKLPVITRGVMRSFLSRPPRWWDATKSFAPYDVALCASGIVAQILCPTRNLPVAEYARLHPTAGAFSQTPVDGGKSMQVFFNPTLGVCNVLSVLSPVAGDKGVLNQAVLLHESLHGWTGSYDTALQDALGLPRAASENITFYLERQIIPGGSQGAVSCQ